MLSAGLAAAVLLLAAALLLRTSGLALLLARAEQQLGREFTGPLPRRLAGALTALLERANEQEHRVHLKHAVTGLPTREPLAGRMAIDGAGTLALLSCRDYDRLCAFDPLLAERLLMTVVERLSVMLPPSRFLAQVDRSHLAIWTGPEVTPAAAEAELAALAYALGDRMVEGDHEILPEIVKRSIRFDAAHGSPHSAISQALSSFSVPLASDGRPKVASINVEAQARDRYQLEQDLRQAIARNQLHMQYQPLIDASEGRAIGGEALIRWHHPQRGPIPPGQFIPLAEAAGLVQEIGLWAMNRALRDARNWRLAGLPDLRVAVNVSGQQLESADLGLLILRTLERHGLPPEALEVELTESVALADDIRAPVLCEDLRSKGVRIAIDDFGTGYSSLSALRNLGFDKLKMDRAFVTDVDKRRDSQAICSSLLALGRGLGANVLAEGVETEAEYGWLRRHGCRYFQGFYFCRPVDSEDFADFVRDSDSLLRQLAAGEPLQLQGSRA